MPIRCVAIDDEPLALLLIKQYLDKLPGMELVASFDDAVSGSEFLRQSKIDLLFLDINMPDITGLELVRNLTDRPMIIFTTAHKKFAHEGFELDAIGYLLKPLSEERFARAVRKAIDYHQYQKKAVADLGAENLFVYSEYRMIKIPLQEIEYIESLEDYIRIHLIHGKPVLTLMPLKKVLEKLPPGKFRRIHRSYIVALDKVMSVLNRKVTLASSAQLPVSNSYSEFIDSWKGQA